MGGPFHRVKGSRVPVMAARVQVVGAVGCWFTVKSRMPCSAAVLTQIPVVNVNVYSVANDDDVFID